MDVMQAIRERRSIRKYRPDPVEPEKLKKIAEAFRLAPSAVNAQNWKLLIVTDNDVKERIKNASPGKPDMLTEAPVVLAGICSTSKEMLNGHRVDSVDVSIALSFAMLEAQELGLGTCWIGYYTEPEMRKALNLSDDYTIVAVMPLGYADENPEQRPRKDTAEVVAYI